jgi:hypothetical protein
MLTVVARIQASAIVPALAQRATGKCLNRFSTATAQASVKPTDGIVAVPIGNPIATLNQTWISRAEEPRRKLTAKRTKKERSMSKFGKAAVAAPTVSLVREASSANALMSARVQAARWKESYETARKTGAWGSLQELSAVQNRLKALSADAPLRPRQFCSQLRTARGFFPAILKRRVQGRRIECAARHRSEGAHKAIEIKPMHCTGV